MFRFLRLVFRSGILYALLWARIKMLETKQRMRNIIKGLLFLSLSKIFWFFGFGMLLASLFFHLSELPKFSSAGLLTAGVSIAAGVLVTLIGIMFLQAKK